ncbi:MAG: hypothetical protein PHF18_00595 [Methanosarcina sp.]|nr:hypothetical protein [Methanosarcina sp.]
MRHINRKKKNKLIQKTFSKKVQNINLSYKIPQGGHKEEIHFYNNMQRKGKIFYTKE